jgi:L-lactate dehydrogenase complex protein LldG
MTAREAILANIRAALGADTARQTAAIPRGYRAATDDNLATFLDRLADYEATTHVVDADELDRAVRSALQRQGARNVVVPKGIPPGWVEGIEPLLDEDPWCEPEALDISDGVLTTCALAIAQTGTIVLDGGPGMGRRALTLLPDYHLCVVRTDQLVGSVPEAIRVLEAEPTRPLTFVSGPSATVDIEMTRVRGVHGPRRLEVIVATAARTNRET